MIDIPTGGINAHTTDDFAIVNANVYADNTDYVSQEEVKKLEAAIIDLKLRIMAVEAVQYEQKQKIRHIDWESLMLSKEAD